MSATLEQHKKAIEDAMNEAACDKKLSRADYIELMDEVSSDAQSRADASRQDQKNDEADE